MLVCSTCDIKISMVDWGKTGLTLKDVNVVWKYTKLGSGFLRGLDMDALFTHCLSIFLGKTGPNFPQN